MNNDYEMTLKSSKIVILCSNREISCPFVHYSLNLTIEKFFGKCYYIFHSKRNLNYNEMEKFCLEKNLKIISIRTKEQARFIFNKILMEEINANRFEKSLKFFNKIETNTFIPSGK